MTYVITAPCIGVKDGSCVDVCPLDAIHSSPSEPQLYIDPELCTDCGACIAACPVEAIFADSDVPEKWTSFIELNASKSRERG
jgi:ferredoxin